MSWLTVNFAIVGAQKCGTTTLAKHLSALDSVSFCREKEPHFFSKSANWRQDFTEYQALYSQGENKLYGEASTSYSFCDEYPDAIKNLYEHNPQMKLIYLIRDPVSRVESHYNHRLRNGRVSSNFIESVGTHPCFIERSLYSKQLAHIYYTFPREQVLVVLFDDLISDPYNTLERVCEFLELAAPKELDTTPQNVSDAKLKLKSPILKRAISALEFLPFSYKLSRFLPIKKKATAAEKQLLWQAFESDLEKLNQWFSLPIEQWQKKYESDPTKRLQ
ncbi:sulfotransferase family protein [Vibrio hannami]|uniref:sulfotransferase family protein n=1 Tax=Vibrio hannami TaxID=2717094 RepID=UPI003EB8EF49